MGAELLIWLGGLSVVLFIGSIVAVQWLVVRIPADYFVGPRAPRSRWADHHRIIRATVLVVRNLVAYVLLLAGIAMLVLPGQGVITIITGLLLADYPGKRPALQWIVGRKPILRALNWIRARAGQPPLGCVGGGAGGSGGGGGGGSSGGGGSGGGGGGGSSGGGGSGGGGGGGSSGGGGGGGGGSSGGGGGAGGSSGGGSAGGGGGGE